MEQITLFDYNTLDSETRIVVQQRTQEIRDRMRLAAQNIIEIGERLIEVKQRLPHGQFGTWLRLEFEWSESSALKMMQVAERFKSVTVTDLNIGARALYLLAAPSTPDIVREEALRRARSGEAVTYKAAQEMKEEAVAVALTDEELLDLKRQVRRRGGTYHGERRINGVVTRHNVTMPNQQERQYTTEQLRELLPAFAEVDEALPPELADAWTLEEHEHLLLARHIATGITTAPGLWQPVVEHARLYQPELDALHADGWTFRADGEVWIAEHEVYPLTTARAIPHLVRQCWQAHDQVLWGEARSLTQAGEFAQAEAIILRMQGQHMKDEAMRVLSSRYRAVRQEAERARLEAMPEPEFDPSPVSVALDDQFDEPEPAAAATEADTRLLDQAEQELPAWSLWIDEDGEACGGQHASGYKIGPVESVVSLVNEARRLDPLLREFAEHNWTCGYHVGLDLWTAEHMQYGTVQASSLPDLAFNAYLARYDRREPDLPRDLWQATWLEGWQFEGHLSGDRYRLVRGGEAWEPTFDELCHVYSYDEQPAPQPEPAVTFPHPLAHEVPDDLPGWSFKVVDKHHVQGTHPDYGTCTATGGSTAAFDQARYTQRQAQQKTQPIPSAEHTAMLTRGEIRNLWKCLHGDQMWLSHARATVERLARQAGVELEEVAA